jgi:putative LysE/RhtB family amino acid efflux pump
VAPFLLRLLAQVGPLSADGAVLVAQGALVGVVVTAPPGPVGGLCVQRTLKGGLVAGLSTALGALLADSFYCVVAAFGLAQVAAPQGTLRLVLAFAVAAALTALGVKYVRRAIHGRMEVEVDTRQAKSRFAGLLGLVAGTFVLTLWTPGTLPAFLVMFASLGIAARTAECAGGPFLVVFGLVLGASAWWLMLCGLVHRFRAHAMQWLRAMEFACGVLLIVGAAGAVWSALRA